MKEYLHGIRAMEIGLRIIEDEITEIETAITRITPNVQGDWVSNSMSNDKMTDGVAKLIDKKREYAKAWDKLIDERAMAEKVLFRMPNKTHAGILWHYYIRAERWEKVATILQMDLRWVFRLHGRALKEFAEANKP